MAIEGRDPPKEFGTQRVERERWEMDWDGIGLDENGGGEKGSAFIEGLREIDM